MHVIDNVVEAGVDFVVGEFQEVRGVDISVASIIALDDELVEGIDISNPKKPQFLPKGVEANDKKASLIKMTIDDLGRELVEVKLSEAKLKATINAMGQELAKTKLELIQMKGGAIS